jgi:hypothetical protein
LRLVYEEAMCRARERLHKSDAATQRKMKRGSGESETRRNGDTEKE